MHLVFDIETVTDTTLWAAPAPEPAPLPVPAETAAPLIPDIGQAAAPKKRTRAKKADAIPKPPKEAFAPLYAHRPVAIGFVLLDDTGLVQAMHCVGARLYGDREAKLLVDWDAYAYGNPAQMVTFGGRSFDVPVLSLRSLRWGINARWITKQVRHRYDEDRHIDLLDALTEFGAVQKNGFTLDALSRVVGLPGKGEVNGGSVAELFATGQLEKLEAYCLSDAVRTAVLFLRLRVLRGYLTVEQYRTAVQALLSAATAKNLGAVTFGVDMPRLMLE